MFGCVNRTFLCLISKFSRVSKISLLSGGEVGIYVNAYGNLYL